MNKEYIKIFLRMSGGSLFHSVENAKLQDPSERVNIYPLKTREIFEKSGLSAADHALWRDTEMLSGMAAIAYEQWSRLNSRNLKIEAEFEEEIADNRNQLNWQDISLNWGEAEILAAEEHIERLATEPDNRTNPPSSPDDNGTEEMSYAEMKRHLKDRRDGIDDSAIQRATRRALDRALEENKLPMPMGGCVDEYAIKEISIPAEPYKKATVEDCKYIFLK